MSFIETGLGSSPRISTQADLERLVLQEILPVLTELRKQLNRTNGNFVTTDESYVADRKDRHVVYDSASPGTVTLPPASDVLEQIFTVYRTGSSGVVTVQAGSATHFPSAGASVTLISDGSSYHPQ